MVTKVTEEVEVSETTNKLAWLALACVCLGCSAESGGDIEIDRPSGAETGETGETGETDETEGISTTSSALIGQGPLAGSCWGHCGETIATMGGQCSCTPSCELDGNCCSDKPKFCPAFHGDSTYVRTILGPGSGVPGLYGTDLGFTYEHRGSLEMLFGDSWALQDSMCHGFDPLVNDDALGTLSVADRNVALALRRTGGTFTPLSLTDGTFGLPLPWGMTPLTGFSDGSRAYALFFRAQDRILEPNYGSPYVELAYRPSESTPTSYLRMHRLFTTKFLNATATTVAAFTGTSTAANYNTGTGAVFIWGRSGFADTGDGAPMYLMYNSLTARSGSTFAWAPQYYGGVSGGQPIWKPTEAEAVPIQGILRDFDSASQMDVAFIPQIGKWVMLYGGDQPDWFFTTDSEHPRRGAIHLRMAAHPWGPWSDPIPVASPYNLAAQLACENPAEEGSSTPYDDVGPWRFADPFLENWFSEWFRLNCTVGDTNRPNPSIGPCLQGDLFACLEAGTNTCVQRPSGDSYERGNLYAPNIVTSWSVDQKGTNGYGQAVDLYWNVSAWNPYAVHLLKTRVEVPDPKVRYDHPYRLDSDPFRYLDNPSGSTLNATSTNSAGFTNHFAFERVSGPDAEHVTFNDLVRIKVRSGQYLRHNSTSSTISVVPRTSASTWRIENAGGATGLIDVNGSQLLTLSTNQTTPRRIRAESGGNTVRLAGGSVTSGMRFRVRWGWQ